jgi:hypothetical protein
MIRMINLKANENKADKSQLSYFFLAQNVIDVIILELRKKLLSKEHKGYFQPEMNLCNVK